jgi:hypothetical protein
MEEPSQTAHLNQRLLASFQQHSIPAHMLRAGGGDEDDDDYDAWADEDAGFSPDEIRRILCFGLLHANKLKRDAYGIPFEVRQEMIAVRA